MDTSMSTSSAMPATSYPASQTSTKNLTPSSTVNEVKTIETKKVDTVAANEPPTMDELKSLVHEGNALLRGANSNLQFQIDDSTKQVVVKVVDEKTGDVIRQFPTVEMLDFIRHMKELEGNAGALIQAVA